MAFKDQVEDYLGITVSDTDALDKWLTSGAKFIVDVLPFQEAEKHATQISVTPNTGTVVTGYRLLDKVECNGYKAIQVPPDDFTKFTTSGSIHLRGVRDGVYRLYGGKIYGAPTSGTWYAYAIAYPTVSNSDSSITNFPSQLESAVVLYAAIQGRLQQLATQVVDIDALAVDITAPTAPVAPIIPDTYTYTDAEASTISVVSVGSLGTTPTYTKPTITPTAPPADLSISSVAPTPPDAPSYEYSDALASVVSQTAIGSLGTPPTYTKPSVTLTEAPSDLTLATVAPTAPLAPAFTYTDAEGTTLSETSIGSLGTAPTYTKPSISLTNAPVIADLDLSSITPPTAPSLPVFVYQDAVAGTIASTTVATFGSAPSYSVTLPEVPTFSITAEAPTALTAPSFTYTDATVSVSNLTQTIDLSTQLTALGTSLDTDEDVELANAKINEIQVRIQEFTGESELALRQAIRNAELTTDLNLRNKAEGLVKQIQEYQAKVNRYANELDKYKADLNAKYQEHTLSLQTYVQNSRNLLEDGLNSFNEANALYQSEITKQIEQARLTQQRLIEAAQLSTDVSKQNEAQTLAAQVQQYQHSLFKYVDEIQDYQQRINSSVIQYRANLDKELEIWKTKRATELQQFSIDVQNELNEFNKELAEYQATVQKAIRQAEITQQRLIDDASRTDNIALQNKARTLEKDIAVYRSGLERFLGQISLYQAGVNAEVQAYQSNLTKWQVLRDTQLKQYSLDIQNEQNEFNKELAEYQATVQKAIRQAELDNQRLLENATRADNAALQNEIQTIASLINSYSHTLQRFNEQIALYAQNVNKEVQQYQSNLQKWQSLREAELRQYGLDIQNEQNEFNKELVEYNANLQKIIKQSELDLERLRNDAERTDNIALQNEIKSLEAIISNWRDKLTKYAEEIQSYGIQINSKLQKYSTQIQQELGKHQALQEGLKELKEQFALKLKVLGV